MNLGYNLDNVFCEEMAREAVIKEAKKYLEEAIEQDNDFDYNTIDITILLEKARNRVLAYINRMYLNESYSYYDSKNLQAESAIMLDKSIKSNVENYNNLIESIEKCNKILNKSRYYDSATINLTKETLEKSENIMKEILNIFNMIKLNLTANIADRTSANSVIFQKAENGKIVVQDWIKPFLNRISFESFPLETINLENYDFSGTKGFNIQSWIIEDNTLANANLNGVNINCNKSLHCNEYNELYPIDPTKINITGTNFTGSKGAVVTLENVDELPENCNLTDAIIAVNSKDDIEKFNLQKYKDKVFIKQDRIVNGEIIDIDFNDFFNYTGTIDKKQFDAINEALKFDCTNEEEIRIENNKIIAHMLTNELSNIIDFDNLYAYFEIFKSYNDYIKDNPEEYQKELNILLNSENQKLTSYNNTRDGLYEIYKKVGSPFSYDIKYTDKDDKFKIYTNHGVFTLDYLRLGLSKDDMELIVKGEKELNVDESTKQKLANLFETLYKYVSDQKDKKENESLNNDDFSMENIFSSLFSSFRKSLDFKNFFKSIVEESIFNSLENNNKGYSYTLKSI